MRRNELAYDPEIMDEDDAKTYKNMYGYEAAEAFAKDQDDRDSEGPQKERIVLVKNPNATWWRKFRVFTKPAVEYTSREETEPPTEVA